MPRSRITAKETNQWLLYIKRGEKTGHIVRTIGTESAINRIIDDPTVDDVFGPIEAESADEAATKFQKFVDFKSVFDPKGKRRD